MFGSTLVVKIKKTQESTPSILKRITEDKENTILLPVVSPLSTWAAVVSLKNFLGPVDDYVTTNTPLTKSQSHKARSATSRYIYV